jgi:capsule polysaccharide modification protein KpsS
MVRKQAALCVHCNCDERGSSSVFKKASNSKMHYCREGFFLPSTIQHNILHDIFHPGQYYKGYNEYENMSVRQKYSF